MIACISVFFVNFPVLHSGQSCAEWGNLRSEIRKRYHKYTISHITKIACFARWPAWLDDLIFFNTFFVNVPIDRLRVNRKWFI